MALKEKVSIPQKSNLISIGKMGIIKIELNPRASQTEKRTAKNYEGSSLFLLIIIKP
jgi:hypothetical protein